MTAPAWLMDEDDEETEELRSLAALTDRPLSEAEIDATASEMLGRMAWYEKQLASANEAEALERERINARYEKRRDPLRKRRAFYEEQVCILAARADFGAKKKSRSVGNGTYGKRETPESVKILDDALAVEWAKARSLGSAIKTTEKPVHKVIAPLVLALVHETGEVPDGFEHVAESVKYYGKPEVE